MEKSSDAFRTIGEMAAELGVKTHILRYWEEHFPMLQPLKRAGGRRHYRTSDVAILHKIYALLHHEGYTIKGAAKYLSGGNTAPYTGTPVAPQIIRETHKFDMGKLRKVRDQLNAALAAA